MSLKTLSQLFENSESVSVVMFIISELAASALVSVFFVDNPALIELTVQGFRVFAISFLFCGINIFASAYFTARATAGLGHDFLYPNPCFTGGDDFVSAQVLLVFREFRWHCRWPNY